MNHDLAFLHTDKIHVPTFQQLVNDIDSSTRVRHEVHEELLANAIAKGMSADLDRDVKEAMSAASDTGAQVVVCTCSTIGGAAENALESGAMKSMRIDRAMADLAVAGSERILVVAAVASTLEPTRALLDESSAKASKNPHISLQLIEGAWPLFEAREVEAYYDFIAQYIHKKLDGYDCVVLAQASMAPVARKFSDGTARVLASPELGVKSAIDLIRSSISPPTG